MTDNRKEMLLGLISQQLKKMDLEALRKAYTALCGINDRGKELFGE